MNEQQSFERFIADSVAGDGRGIPLRESRYQDTDAQVRRTRQLPRWLALLLERPMRRSSQVAVGSPSLRMATVTAATLLTAGLMAGLGVAGQHLLAGDEPIVVDQSGAGNFTTVSEAVDAAPDGATILVRPGRYVESVIVMGKDLVISGDGDMSREEIVIEAAPGALPVDFAPASGDGAPDLPALLQAGEPYAWAVLLADTRTELSGLTVIGPNVGTAIPVIGAGSVATLRDIVLRVPGPASGHWLSANWTEGTSGSLRGSIVEGWLAVGPDTDVVIEGNDLPATCLVAWDTGADLVVRKNTLHGCPYEKGLDIGAGNTVVVEANDIWVEDVPEDATVDGYSGGRPAIQVEGPEGSVTIVDNTLHDSVYGIIVSGDGPELEVRGNAIRDNGVGVSGIDGLSRLVDNEITGNVTGVQIGFFVDPTLERNLIADNEVGLSIDGNSNPQLVDNTVCGNGVNVQSPAGSPMHIDASETCEEKPAE